MAFSTSVHDIKTLILSFHPVIVIDSVDEERVMSLMQSAAAATKLPLFEWTIIKGLRRLPGNIGIAGTSEPLGVVRHLEALTVQGIFLLKDFTCHLGDAATARQFRELAHRFTENHSTLVLAGAVGRLPPEIEHLTVRYRLELPKEDELRKVVSAVLSSLQTKNLVRVDLDPEDLEALVRAVRGMTANQARQAIAYAALDDGELTARDIAKVLERKAGMLQEGGLLEYFPVEDNRYEMGGFERLKEWLDRARVGFTAEARALNLSAPRGILLVGVQGCGKSLAAKYIARRWTMPLLKLDAARLYDKYVGESEKNFRRATELAESMAPVVLWIDEIEKGFMVSGSSHADSGLSRRLFGSFLTWLQEKNAEVFVVATANDLSDLPPELLRKGRFDEIFFVDLPAAEEREAIFEIHLNLRKQDPSAFRLADLVAATEGFSGAEIEQAVIASLYRALAHKQPLTTELLLTEISATVPLSVSRRENIERLREIARERFVPVS